MKFKRASFVRSLFVAGLAGWSVWTLDSGWAIASPLQAEAAKPAQEEEKKAEPSGPLEEVASSLSEAIALEFSGGKLKTKFPDQAGGQTLFQALLRVGGGGGSSSGGNNWRHNVRGNKITGGFGTGSTFPMPARDRPIGNYLHLVERQAPNRQIHYENSENEVQVMVIDPSTETVLRLKQTESGTVLLQMVTPDLCSAFQAASFNDLWFEHSELMSERFFPLLRRLGIGTPSVDLTEKLQAQVLNDLAYGATRQAEFLESFRDLEAEDYQARAAATDRLEREFAQWSLAIARGMREPTLNLEVRARLKKVFEAKATADEKATADLMSSQQLENNSRFLAQLLADCRSPEESELVLKQLRVVAGKDLGADVESWRQWAAEAQPPREEAALPEFSSTRPLKVDATYFKARPEISRLARLTADDNQLMLDREEWGKRFGGKPIAQLAQEISQHYEATNLPKAWLSVGDGYDLATTDYPQVLFEDVVNKLVEGSPYAQMHFINRRNQAAQRPKSFNREFDIQHASGELEQHSENRAQQPNEELKAEYLKLNLRDMNSEGSLLSLEEFPDGVFSLCFVDQAMDIVLLVSRRPGQPARIALLRGAESLFVEDANPARLFEQNRELFREKLVPVLQHAGIDLSQKLGGPLEINAPAPIEK